MKFTIELSAIEVIGIKEYLKQVCDESPTKENITRELQSIVQGYINSPQVAISDYIKDISKYIPNINPDESATSYIRKNFVDLK